MQDLRSVLKANGFEFKKKFGQNFISDTNLLRSIVELSGITKDTIVVEIGCGAGTLTREIAAAAKHVHAFDVDRDLIPVLAETLKGVENADVTFQDFMKVNLKEFEAEIGEYVVVANLPYYITTPLVTKLLEEGEKVRGLTIMVQEEVADRFCAKENTAEYGSITAAIALKGTAKVVKRVSRKLFYPSPNVDSAVVKIEFERGRVAVKDERAYRQTVKCAFLNRRKTLENNLVNFFKLTREQAKAVLVQAGVAEKARGETLSPQALAILADVLLDNGYIKL